MVKVKLHPVQSSTMPSRHMGSGDIAAHILNLGIRCRSMVSSMSWSRIRHLPPTGQEAVWDPELIWALGRRDRCLSPAKT
jgi:hypothetical protein